MQTHANAYKHLQTCRRIHAAEMRTHVTCLQIRLIYTTESERDWEKKNQRRWHPQQQGALTTPSFHKCFRFSWSWDWAAISSGITIYTLESMYCILHIMLWDSSLQNHCILYIIAVPLNLHWLFDPDLGGFAGQWLETVPSWKLRATRGCVPLSL